MEELQINQEYSLLRPTRGKRKEDIQIEATNKVQPKIQKVMDWQFENGIRGDGKNHQNNLMFESNYGDKIFT